MPDAGSRRESPCFLAPPLAFIRRVGPAMTQKLNTHNRFTDCHFGALSYANLHFKNKCVISTKGTEIPGFQPKVWSWIFRKVHCGWQPVKYRPIFTPICAQRVPALFIKVINAPYISFCSIICSLTLATSKTNENGLHRSIPLLSLPDTWKIRRSTRPGHQSSSNAKLGSSRSILSIYWVLNKDLLNA